MDEKTRDSVDEIDFGSYCEDRIDDSTKNTKYVRQRCSKNTDPTIYILLVFIY